MVTANVSRWRKPSRWLFLCSIAVSLALLWFAVRDQLQRAEMSLGTALTIDTASTLSTAILNRKDYIPPRSGLPTTAQLGFALRVARLDSVFQRNGVASTARALALAREFNQSMMSLAEYRWIASTIIRHYTTNVLTDAPFHRDMESRLRMIDDLLMRATKGNVHRLLAVIDDTSTAPR